MKKIGPLSLDFVVACQIYELEKEDIRPSFSILADKLGKRNLVSRSALSPILSTLATWGVIDIKYELTEAGRAGRMYYISGEAQNLVKEMYEKYWEKVLESKK